MKIHLIAALVLFSLSVFAQAPKVGRDVDPDGVRVKEVGRGAAAKYLGRGEAEETKTRSSHGENFLMLLTGPYINSASYAWKGSDKRTGIARNSYGVTYLFDQWHNIDTNIRIDFTDFQIDDERLLKMSLMPLWTFPMVETRFPLYFGIGAGLGVFFKQVEQESNISLDYQLVTGLRFPDLLENAGFVLEFGMKNHVHVISDGQLNATALSIGAIFSF